MKILVACEFSDTVRKAFSEKGHYVWSCDLLPSENKNNQFHWIGDVQEIFDWDWDMMIAHPPCTYLANSGVKHLHKKPERWCQMDAARLFFMKLYKSNIPKICIENPVPHGYCALPDYQQIIQPWQHGHEVTKKTCLWLKNLPKLKPSKIVDKGERYFGKNGKSNGALWYQIPPSGERWKVRSRTFQGIADAMADQWG